MAELRLNAYREATRTTASPHFTAKVFAAVGIDRYVVAVTPLGELFVAWNARGVSGVRRAGDEGGFEAWYAQRTGRRVVPALEDDPISRAARAKLRGEEAEVPIDLQACSPFEQRVLRKATEIGRGSARPYSWVAREIGAPDSARAVGNALARNPVPLLIPCHRVLRTDYAVGGYVFGTEAKRTLLEREGMDLQAVEDLMRRGFRYVACDDEDQFCLLTCGDVASHRDSPGYRAFRSATEARAHGLRPCESCRPVAA